jgi:hypothetical protein
LDVIKEDTGMEPAALLSLMFDWERWRVALTSNSFQST